MSIPRRIFSTSPRLIQSVNRFVHPLLISRIPSVTAFTPIRTMADMTPVFSKDAAPRKLCYSITATSYRLID